MIGPGFRPLGYQLKSSEFDLGNKYGLVYVSQSLDFSLFKKTSLLIRYNSISFCVTVIIMLKITLAIQIMYCISLYVVVSINSLLKEYTSRRDIYTLRFVKIRLHTLSMKDNYIFIILQGVSSLRSLTPCSACTHIVITHIRIHV